MSGHTSIRTRLLLWAALVLVAFVAAAGFALQRAHADSVRSVHFSRLQGTIYLLLAKAELDGAGRLQMPADLAEPRLALPASGLYARVRSSLHGEQWRSPSTLGVDPAFPQAPEVRGAWRNEDFQQSGKAYLAVSYAVRWATGAHESQLQLTAMEDRAGFDRELAVFARTLWSWLVGAAVLLLIAQSALLRWALSPLRRVGREIARIEQGEQQDITGRYPVEIAALTDGLNALIRQERARQVRYREALSFLAHSLKTPLAVLRGVQSDPARLQEEVGQQVQRMDAIVQHQLARAAAGGPARFAAPTPVAPVLQRVRDALLKVHAGRGLVIAVECAPDLRWRVDEGDLFEIAGNLMDNAGKWARSRVDVRAWVEDDALQVRVEDDGPGFTDTEAVLQLHVRGDERVPGHGVGLAVVNDIVASHGGRLELERTALGGARVHLRLPAP
jgi:two-component system sensor histidine kinase PhoQ